MNAVKSPIAFISYSWDDETHKQRVRNLATRLRYDGVDVRLDQWEIAPGDQLPEFMERSLRESDFILIICTPEYKMKSDGRDGGVGYEGHIMTTELYTTHNYRKFIPLLSHAKSEESIPTWLRGAYHIDLFNLELFEGAYKELVDTLHGRQQQAPPLGKPPSDGDEVKLNELASSQTSTSERVKSSQLLLSVEQRLKEPLDNLNYIAGEVLVSISNVFDNHDQRAYKEKHLRHVYYDFCKSISSALCSQITWQTSTNLHWRLRPLADVEADVNDVGLLSGRLNFVMYYSRDPEPKGIFKLWQKGAPVKGHKLVNNINTIYRNIPIADTKQMFLESLNRSQRYFQQYEKTKPVLKEVLAQLHNRLELDGYFETESKMSDKLYKRYKDLLNKLEFLGECGLRSIRGANEICASGCFSNLIYIGTILAIVSDYHDWGKDMIRN